MSVPQPFLASSRTGTQGPPWSELLTRLLDSTLPQGRGVGGSQSVCPLLSLIQLGLLWARASLGTQDTPQAEGISALSHNLRAMGRDDTDTPEGRPSPFSLPCWRWGQRGFLEEGTSQLRPEDSEGDNQGHVPMVSG